MQALTDTSPCSSLPAMLRGSHQVPCAVAVVACLATAAPAAAKTGPTLRLTADRTNSTFVDLAPAGPSVGDRWAIDVPLRDAAGTPAGTFRADQTAIAIRGGSETVQTQGVLELADGSITFAGAARAPLGQKGLTVGDSYERAVTGGTGRYAGASGTLVTRRRADGVYEEIARLVLPDGAPTSMTIPGLEGSVQRIDLDPAGFGPGDLVAVRGGVADTPAGVIAGTQAVITPDSAALRVLSVLTFSLPTGDLAVVGPGAIATDGGMLVNGQTFDRAVVGGTRGFVGRGGTQTVTRAPDGTYHNVLALWAPQGKAVQLRLTSKNTALKTADVAGGAARFQVFEERLLDRRGRRVGQLLGTGTSLVDGGTATSVAALMTLRLPGGTIIVGGARPRARTRTVSPVIGGTGRYAGMRGTLTATPGPTQTIVNVLRLQRVG
jgi:hypothetical protein